MLTEQVFACLGKTNVQDFNIVVQKIQVFIVLPQPASQELLIASPVITDIRTDQDMGCFEIIEYKSGDGLIRSMGNDVNISIRDGEYLPEEIFPKMPATNAECSRCTHNQINIQVLMIPSRSVISTLMQKEPVPGPRSN